VLFAEMATAARPTVIVARVQIIAALDVNLTSEHALLQVGATVPRFLRMVYAVDLKVMSVVMAIVVQRMVIVEVLRLTVVMDAIQHLAHVESRRFHVDLLYINEVRLAIGRINFFIDLRFHILFPLCKFSYNVLHSKLNCFLNIVLTASRAMEICHVACIASYLITWFHKRSLASSTKSYQNINYKVGQASVTDNLNA